MTTTADTLRGLAARLLAEADALDAAPPATPAVTSCYAQVAVRGTVYLPADIDPAGAVAVTGRIFFTPDFNAPADGVTVVDIVDADRDYSLHGDAYKAAEQWLDVNTIGSRFWLAVQRRLGAENHLYWEE